jgi:sRNA-binding protein
MTTDFNAIIAKLAELFPATFFVSEHRRKPRKLGIYDDLVAATAGTIEPSDLKGALRVYTSNLGYIRSGAQPDAVRIDLAGNVAGPVDADHAEQLRQHLAAVRGKRKPKQQPQKCKEPVDKKPVTQTLGNGKEDRRERETASKIGALAPTPPATTSGLRRASLSDLRPAAQARRHRVVSAVSEREGRPEQAIASR